MFDLKVLNSALDQLHEEKGISREKIIDAIETALAAAYKKDYGKKGQLVRAEFDLATGATEFSQVKIVVDETTVRMLTEEDEAALRAEEEKAEQHTGVRKHTKEEFEEEEDVLPLFNPERHILIEDARKIKKNAELDEEIIFPLETKDDYGRIAAQTAKQVIIQKIREAEKEFVLDEYSTRVGEIITGIVHRVERGNVFIEIGRVVAMLPREEQIPGEQYQQGAHIKAYILDVTEGLRGVNIRLSRTNPEFLTKLFETESPEIASGTVEIKSVAREPGSRSKIAVHSTDEKIDPIGALVGQRGVRVNTVSTELAGEKIDIIEWSANPARFITEALSPAKILNIDINEEAKTAKITVDEDQMSLAIGKGGQNVRLANKLTGWGIDIEGTGTPADMEANGAEEIEQQLAEEEIAEEIMEEAAGGEVAQAETEDNENTTPEEVEEEIEEAEEVDAEKQEEAEAPEEEEK